jgi:hypothetical protein
MVIANVWRLKKRVVGGRYWMRFLRVVGMYRQIKTPVVARVEVGKAHRHVSWHGTIVIVSIGLVNRHPLPPPATPSNSTSLSSIMF